MSEEIELKVGQRWVHKLMGRTIRIMAISEGYLMVRYKGGAPFVIYSKHMIDNYHISYNELKKKNNGKKTSPGDKS